MTREMKFTIHEKDAGRVLSEFLAARFTYHSVAEWCGLASEGRVRVNGRACDAEVALRTGDVLSYDASGIQEPPVDERVDVILDDPLLLVVSKSGNLPCHPGGRYFNHTLWALAKSRFGVKEPVLVNRIDRETSGLVIIGKTPEAAHNLWTQFAAHRVEKGYTVVVEGAFPDRVEASGWLVQDRESVIRKKRRFLAEAPRGVAPEPRAEWAETVLVRESACGACSVVRALPKTGRLHQIRATLLALGFPVVGDKLYGVDETLFLRFCGDALSQADLQLLRVRRQALHADYLMFRHPKYGARTELCAPLPADMESLLRGLKQEA
jgi:23S rRNA pseudouridine955/2504/2580 synthase/23S rRNA pseudouridine1911/1915/1917 synthase